MRKCILLFFIVVVVVKTELNCTKTFILKIDKLSVLKCENYLRLRRFVVLICFFFSLRKC